MGRRVAQYILNKYKSLPHDLAASIMCCTKYAAYTLITWALAQNTQPIVESNIAYLCYLASNVTLALA